MSNVSEVLKSAQRDKWSISHGNDDDSGTTGGETTSTIRYVRQGNMYRPVSDTVPLSAGSMYVVKRDNHGLLLIEQSLIHDDLIDMKDSVSSMVIAELDKFWSRRDRYGQIGRLYKRGILMHGKPGVGKTATVIQVSHRVMSTGGFVIFAECPDDLADAIGVIRVSNPNEAIVAMLEDVETITEKHGESTLLSLLDGERQIDNVVFIATTNFIEKLGDRFAKRPSRFDLVVEVLPPSADLRRQYIINTLPEIDPAFLAEVVAETAGFSISHLKELILLMHVYDYTLDDAVVRVRAMLSVDDEDDDGDEDAPSASSASTILVEG